MWGQFCTLKHLPLCTIESILWEKLHFVHDVKLFVAVHSQMTRYIYIYLQFNHFQCHYMKKCGPYMYRCRKYWNMLLYMYITLLESYGTVVVELKIGCNSTWIHNIIGPAVYLDHDYRMENSSFTCIAWGIVFSWCNIILS
jgi:hypothetical protein